jgi:hypothetical protein
MAVEMVDRHEREPARPRERLGGGEPYEERADQARAARDGDGLHVVEGRARILERLGEDGADELQMAS